MWEELRLQVLPTQEEFIYLAYEFRIKIIRVDRCALIIISYPMHMAVSINQRNFFFRGR